MTQFKMLAKRVIEEAERQKREVSFFIVNGYRPTWAEEYRADAARGLREYSTARRWEQYQAGEISREKAAELATKRAIKAIEKDTAAKLARLERVANAPDLEYISVCVDWVYSNVWGRNPHAECVTNSGVYYGKASGCGYDKESAAIAEAFNKCDSILKAVYRLKENGLKSGKTDRSATACTNIDNRNICGYGAGYSVLPYFESGVGVFCYWFILKQCGFKVREHQTQNCNYYIIEREARQ